MDKQDKNVRKRNSIISMIIYICYDKSASTSIMILIWDKGSLAAVLLPLGNKKWKQLEAVGSKTKAAPTLRQRDLTRVEEMNK